MSGIGVIHNPFARKNLKNPGIAERLSKILDGYGSLYETKDVRELDSVALDFMEKGYDILAVNGGDGSLHNAMTAFVKCYCDQPLPKIVILRGGTMNTVSNSLKLKGGPESILEKLVDFYKKGKEPDIIPQKLLKVNNRYGFITGAGAVSEFLDDYYAGGSIGVVQALKMIFMMISSAVFRTDYVKKMFSPLDMSVVVDGKNLGKKSYVAVLGASVSEVGVGFSLTFRANEKPEFFHFIATSMSPIAIVLRIGALWAGKNIVHSDMYHHGISREVVIESKNNLRWMLDGDMYQTTEPLKVSVGPVISVLRL